MAAITISDIWNGSGAATGLKNGYCNLADLATAVGDANLEHPMTAVGGQLGVNNEGQDWTWPDDAVLDGAGHTLFFNTEIANSSAAITLSGDNGVIKNLRMIGDPAIGAALPAVAHSTYITGAYKEGIVVTADNCRIENVELGGFGDNSTGAIVITGDRAVVDGCLIWRGWAGIVANGDYCHINNCFITDTSGAIHVSRGGTSSFGTRITNCNLNRNWLGGVALWGAASTVHIDGCVFERNQDAASPYANDTLYQGDINTGQSPVQNLVITNCRFPSVNAAAEAGNVTYSDGSTTAKSSWQTAYVPIKIFRANGVLIKGNTFVQGTTDTRYNYAMVGIPTDVADSWGNPPENNGVDNLKIEYNVGGFDGNWMRVDTLVNRDVWLSNFITPQVNVPLGVKSLNR